jgi:hypothetical protein
LKPVTVACVFVRGHVPFTVEYVRKLHAMCGRWLTRRVRFVCLTDRPEQMPTGVEGIRIKLPRGLFGWWAKVQLFNPEHGFTGRMLYLDLDTLVVDELDPIVDYPASFALAPHGGRFEGRQGRAVVRRFNSSVMVWDAGTADHLYTDWTEDISDRLWGDQDWIGERHPDAAAMPSTWFPRISEVRNAFAAASEAKVVLCKSPKNVEAARKYAWVREAWQ